MLPSILNLVGADSLTSLRRLAAALPRQSVDGKAPLATGEDDADEVPDLVENFDEAEEATLAEVTGAAILYHGCFLKVFCLWI